MSDTAPLVPGFLDRLGDRVQLTDRESGRRRGPAPPPGTHHQLAVRSGGQAAGEPARRVPSSELRQGPSDRPAPGTRRTARDRVGRRRRLAPVRGARGRGPVRCGVSCRRRAVPAAPVARRRGCSPRRGARRLARGARHRAPDHHRRWSPGGHRVGARWRRSGTCRRCHRIACGETFGWRSPTARRGRSAGSPTFGRLASWRCRWRSAGSCAATSTRPGWPACCRSGRRRDRASARRRSDRPFGDGCVASCLSPTT